MYIDKSEVYKTCLRRKIFLLFRIECESVTELALHVFNSLFAFFLTFFGVKSLITLNRITFKSSNQILAYNLKVSIFLAIRSAPYITT